MKMEEGRVGSSSDPASSHSKPHPSQPKDATSTSPKRNHWLRLLLLLLLSLLSASLIISAMFIIGFRVWVSENGGSDRKPTDAIWRACRGAQYRTHCVDSLLNLTWSEKNASLSRLAHMTLNHTRFRIGRALHAVSKMRRKHNNKKVKKKEEKKSRRIRSAYADCTELLHQSVHLLARSLSLSSSGSAMVSRRRRREDVVTWLSGAMTNHDTCAKGLMEDHASSSSEEVMMMMHRLDELWKVLSNCLSIYVAAAAAAESYNNVPPGTPKHNRRRRRLMGSSSAAAEEHIIINNNDDDNGAGYRFGYGSDDNYPEWVKRKDRELLETPVSDITYDIVVKWVNGTNGTKAIQDAIKRAPANSHNRFTILIKTGT